METIECRTCKGVGHKVETLRYSGSGVGNKTRTRKWTCQYCKGTGVLEIDIRPLHERYEKATGELPDWMTE